MVVKLWLVRHGETEWNANRRFQGWTDVGLTDVGRGHAAELAAMLAGRRFDGVWSSDLSRAVETARIAFGEPTTDSRLRELHFGDLEGSVWDDLDDTVRAQLVGFDEFVAPGGESVEAFKRRVIEFLDTLQGGDHLVVTHGGVIRMLARQCGTDGFPGHTDILVLDWTRRREIEQ